MKKLQTTIRLLFCALVSLTCLQQAAARQNSRTDISAVRRSGTDKNILIATHRGGLWQRFPENSLEAIRAAIEVGADFIEVDVRKTKDNQLILMHDQTLDRCTNGKGRVREHTLAQIQALYLKDKNRQLTKFRVPTLREALLAMKGRVFIKVDKYNEEKILDKIVAVLDETGTMRQASFRAGLDYEKFRNRYEGRYGRLHVFPALEGDTSIKNAAAALHTFRTNVNPVVFQAKFKDPASAVVPHLMPLNRAGYHIWTMASRPYYCGGFDDKVSLTDPEKGWGRLIALGVTIIETDYPEQLLAYLKQRKLHP
ncbi:glycerophosphodiester phosphodiesterase [Pedobacter yulinensis]|uniref:Glycerophosphodiester phosphodiesterase n=1 Tax=Pedobacter yulinensis TaxID=2126353 RepID=A0A2T3HMN6_9SPHI|nr:glycerophosphodiester phosphodiesterase family protein [Pedobacter yulinensis]PST83696.1 glycerophosphodiester phosphodiesterase [Pedobacter yulinensis]